MNMKEFVINLVVLLMGFLLTGLICPVLIATSQMPPLMVILFVLLWTIGVALFIKFACMMVMDIWRKKNT
jgi:hypothetical protein